MTFKKIDVAGCKDLMMNEEICILDIRDAQSFELGCIEGALHIEQIDMDDFIEQHPNEKPLVICCFHGNSSLSAADFFVEKGLLDVYSLEGGYEAWRCNT